MTNLQWVAIFLCFPLLIFALLDYHIFLKHLKIFVRVWIAALIFALPWDILAVAKKAWTFPQGLTGIYILTLPIEEYIWGILFAAVITYLTLFLLKYHGK